MVNTTKNVDTTPHVKPMSDQELDTLSVRFGESLSNQEKVLVRIPLLPGEGGAVECCINGHNFVIKRGTTLELPRPVVDLLSNAGIV